MKTQSVKDEWLVAFLSGMISGFVSNLIFYPLDVVETRQQIEKRFQNASIQKCATMIWKQEGWRSFYIAWIPGVVGISMNWAIYFTIFDLTMNSAFLTQVLQLQEEASKRFSSGIVAGLLTSICVNPFWVVKNRMLHNHCLMAKKSESKSFDNSTWGVLKTIVFTQGLSALWSGVLPSMAGCLRGAIQFMIYHELKKYVLVFSLLSDSLFFFVIGSLSSLVATCLTYPYMTIRTAIQVNINSNVGIVQIISGLIRAQGMASLYTGLYTNLIRQVPTSGCMLCILELVKVILRVYI